MLNTQKGFTILEILLTIILLVGGIIALMSGFSTGLLTGSDAENTTVAVNLAQRRVEEYKNLDFDTGIISEAKADVAGFSGFQREVAVTEPLADLKQVTVTVYWTFKADETSVSFATYISKN